MEKLKKAPILSILASVLFITNVYSQSIQDSTGIENSHRKAHSEILKTLILDAKNQTPLPYANVYLLDKKKGLISNEEGYFSINTSKFRGTDTLRISYMGYQAKEITIKELKTFPIISLNEEDLMLNDITLFGNTPDPKLIVKKVLENKYQNYPRTTSKKKLFIREKEFTDLNQLNLDFKKSSFIHLNNDLVKFIEKNVVRKSVSFTDFMGDIYLSNIDRIDSLILKVDPIKIIELKEESELKDIIKKEKLDDATEKFMENIKKALSNNRNDEYWKVKTGIIGYKFHVEENSDSNQIKLVFNDTKTDSLSSDRQHAFREQKTNIETLLSISTLEDEEQWEFLHQTNKYHYTLNGGTIANGEDVYIIDFKPKFRGKYEGRIYIAMNSFALLRVDYHYAPGKTGRNIKLFGIRFSENEFRTSIYFEKKDDAYALKYYSKKEVTYLSIDRTISFLKKKKRVLVDQKLEQIKMGLNYGVSTKSSIEMLILKEEKISQKQFSDFKEKDNIETIYVNQFDEKLWKGYSIIEPTKQMKDYKKMNMNTY